MVLAHSAKRAMWIAKVYKCVSCKMKTRRVFRRGKTCVGVCSSCRLGSMPLAMSRKAFAQARRHVSCLNKWGAPCCGRVLCLDNVATYKTFSGQVFYYTRDLLREMRFQSERFQLVVILCRGLPEIVAQMVMAFTGRQNLLAEGYNKIKKRRLYYPYNT